MHGVSPTRWIPVLVACVWAAVSVRSGGFVDAVAHREGAHGPGAGFHVHVHGEHHGHGHTDGHDADGCEPDACADHGDRLHCCCDAGGAVPAEGSAVPMLPGVRVVTAGAEPVVPEIVPEDAGAERARWLASAAGVRPGGVLIALRSVVLTT